MKVEKFMLLACINMNTIKRQNVPSLYMNTWKFRALFISLNICVNVTGVASNEQKTAQKRTDRQYIMLDDLCFEHIRKYNKTRQRSQIPPYIT